MPVEEKVTDEQAEEALQQLVTGEHPESEVTQPEEEVTEDVVTTAPEETPAPVEPEVEPVTESDDVKSLRAQIEEDRKRNDDRFKAQGDRHVENERILHDRLLRKSTATDRARQALNAALTEEGVSKEDVQRVIGEIEGTMNPQSSTFVAPQPSAVGVEDQTIVVNNFLSEKGLTQTEGDEFGTWIKTEAPTAMSLNEQNVAGRDLDGFLRIAHNRWQENMQQKKETKTNDAVEAVRSVQRTQKLAAKAGSTSTTAPKKGVANPKSGGDEVDRLMKLKGSQREDAVAALVRASVEQYHP